MALEYFIAYHSLLKSIEPLNDSERGRLFTACLIYSMTGEMPELKGNERFIFPTIQGQIDRDKEKYFAKCEKQREIANMRWHTNACERIPNDANDAKKNTNTNTKKNKKENNINKSFSPPSLEEVQDYVKEKNLSVDPVRFYNYFSEGNWVDSKGNKVKNWKQKILTWSSYGNGIRSEKPKKETSYDLSMIDELDLMTPV